MPEPIGQRFSLVYLERGVPANDSARFRRRLAEQFSKLCDGWGVESEFGEMLVAEAGTEVRRSPSGHYFPRETLVTGELRDVLDAITLFYTFLQDRRSASLRESARELAGRAPPRTHLPRPEVWREFVARAMQEEAVGYRVDEACGVHYFVDQEFERNRAATLAVLEHPSLVNARAAYDDAFRHMDSQPRDTKAAVRSTFEAVEIVAKQICPEAKNLNRWLADNTLKERCAGAMPGDATEKKVFEGMFSALGDWVDAVHFYRHGQNAEEPVAPSEELAVYVLSTGSAHVRLLARAHLRLLGSVELG